MIFLSTYSYDKESIPPDDIKSSSVFLPQKSRTQTGISLRAVVIGLFLVAAVCFIVCYAELVAQSIQIGFLQMPPVVIGVFFFITLLNKGMQRFKHFFHLSSAEMMIIYCMMLVAAMISSRGIMEKVIPALVTPNYFASPANKWHELYNPNIRKWLVPFDPQGEPEQFVTKRFYERLREGESIPWGDWAVPLAAWGILVMLVVFAFLCLATILRKQWVDNEKLAFPLVQPPLELVRETAERSIFQNKLLWGGALLPACIFALNGLHNIYPNLPSIGLERTLNEYLVNPPWNQLYFTPIYFSFAAIGFFFLLPSDLLFSLWFFALFARLQGIIAAAYNMEPEYMPMYGTRLFIAYQVVGAYLVLAGYMFYVSLPHLKKVLRAALYREKADDALELMPYSFAFWGLFVSLGLIVGWCYCAGMTPWVAALEFGVFLFVVALVMARSTAEAGMLMTETSFRPVDLYRLIAPVHNLGANNLTMLAFLDAGFMRDQRGLLLTGFLDGLKISDGVGIQRRTFLFVFLIGIISALIFAGFLHIWIPYKYGALILNGYVYRGNNLWSFSEYQTHLSSSVARSWQAPVFFAVGIIFTIILSYMRAMFSWWPLHPLGYALCISWTMTVFWFSCLIAWIGKSLILRYGGMKLYMKTRPWFLGMVLGEFGSAVIWTLIAAIWKTPTPSFPWP